MVELLAGPWGPLVIFGFRICDVSLSTLRLLLTVRGRRLLPPVIGFFEVLIWLMAAGAAVQNLSSPWHVLGYAGGFAAGNFVGLWVESRLALGLATIQVVSKETGPELAESLRGRGHAVTRVLGHGRDGEVQILYSTVRRRYVPEALGLVESLDPSAFVSVQEDRLARRGWLLAGRRK